MKAKGKILLTSFAAMGVAALAMGGATYALFTSGANTNISVTSAKVKVTAGIENLKLYSAEWDETEGDYVYGSERQAFIGGGTATIDGGTLTLAQMAPLDKVTFDVVTENQSDIIIKTRSSIECAGNQSLFDALDITIDGQAFSGHYSLTDWAQWAPTDVSTKTQSVVIEFKDHGESDVALQGLSTAIKFAVEAVQVNAHVTNAEGAGTEASPYQVGSVNEFRYLLDSNTFNGNPYFGNIFYGDGTNRDPVCIELAGDIDLAGVAMPGKDYIDNIVFDGNGHTISNMEGSLFGEDSWVTGESVIKNLVIENATSDSSAFGYGHYSRGDSYETVKFENITIKNSKFKDGAFLGWCPGGYDSKVEVKNCHLENVEVTYFGGAGAVGGFFGNAQNVKFDNCSIKDSKIETTSQIVGGFIGMNTAGTATTITNSSIQNTVIKSVASNGVVKAFGDGSYNNGTNSFNGTLVCANSSGANKNGFTDAVWQALEAVDGSKFVIGADGTITYTGTETFAKVVVKQNINVDRFDKETGEKRHGGFPYIFGTSLVKENVAQDVELGKIFKVAAVKNVAPYKPVLKNAVDSLPEGLEFAQGFAYGEDGTLYLNSGDQGSSDIDYFSGTYMTDTATFTRVTLIIEIYNAAGNIVNTTSNSYVVAL